MNLSNLLIWFYLFLVSSLFSQTDSDFLLKTKNSFLTTTKQALTEKSFTDTNIQLVTISPGVTLSTAFGHSAIRVRYGKEYDITDFYIDFGQYDETVSFLWRFLRGDARFHFVVLPTASAYEFWDSSGRGFYVSEFKLNLEQKEKMLTEIVRLMEHTEGYEYSNFTSNCVTFIRDIINHTYQIKLELATSKNQNTWRNRVITYSNKNIWLRIQEKLLFDHDTDKERNSSELIYLPLDLQISAEDAKVVQEMKVLIPDRWGIGKNSIDFIGYFTFLIFIFMVVSQIPKGILFTYERYGKKLFSLLSGLGGSFALLVLLITKFDFMDENIIVLVFTPLDFILLKKNCIEHRFFNQYLILRFIMIVIALILRLTVWKQNIDFILFFTFLFFIINIYTHIIKKIERINA